MSTVISVEGLSKIYHLGQIGTGTFANDLNVWWAKVRGKPNPYLKINEKDHGNREGEELWALRDINFNVDQGDVLGIIGRNGAGKSTLLKILSRVTSPSAGVVKIKGRIASLLEVGTGFHPDLTGRENIFLNGAILGMNRTEIQRKFDEILDFSGVEQFVDTPVKRFSSGMYVRLAFAVAAHLDPEILIVDEVLAVGDAEFQKRCLGKMGDVAKEGRTVFFVSHNMAAISALCKKCMLLTAGVITNLDQTENVVSQYLSATSEMTLIPLSERTDRKGSGKIILRSCEIIDSSTRSTINPVISGQDIIFKIGYESKKQSVGPSIDRIRVGIQIFTSTKTFITALNPYTLGLQFDGLPTSGYIYCYIPKLPLMYGHHYVNLVLHQNNELLDMVEDAYTFDVETGDFFNSGVQNSYGRQGVFFEQKWGKSLDEFKKES